MKNPFSSCSLCLENLKAQKIHIKQPIDSNFILDLIISWWIKKQPISLNAYKKDKQICMASVMLI